MAVDNSIANWYTRATLHAMTWEAVARRQGGNVTTGQLSSCGISRGARRTMIANGQLLPGFAGVYSAAGSPATYESRLWAAVLATNGTLGFATAAHRWKTITEPDDLIDVIVAVGPGHRRLPGIRLHRVQLAPGDRSTLGGLPVTTRTCSTLDYLSRLSPGRAITFADRALQQAWITRGDIAHRLKSQPGRTGNTRLREILDSTGDGAAAESERVLHSLLRCAKIAGWLPNVEVRSGPVVIAVLDVAFEELKIGIEIDGMAHHTDVERFQRDRTRQNNLVERGWTILRFTWADLTHRPGYVIKTIRSAILLQEAG